MRTHLAHTYAPLPCRALRSARAATAHTLGPAGTAVARLRQPLVGASITIVVFVVAGLHLGNARIALGWIGAVDQDLFAVGASVAIGIGQIRVRADEPLGVIGDPVSVIVPSAPVADRRTAVPETAPELIEEGDDGQAKGIHGHPDELEAMPSGVGGI